MIDIIDVRNLCKKNILKAYTEISKYEKKRIIYLMDAENGERVILAEEDIE